jgi:hypothetical protein
MRTADCRPGSIIYPRLSRMADAGTIVSECDITPSVQQSKSSGIDEKYSRPANRKIHHEMPEASWLLGQKWHSIEPTSVLHRHKPRSLRHTYVPEAYAGPLGMAARRESQETKLALQGLKGRPLCLLLKHGFGKPQPRHSGFDLAIPDL